MPPRARARSAAPTDLPAPADLEPSSPPSPPRPSGPLAFRQPETDPTSLPTTDPWADDDSPSESDASSDAPSAPSDESPRSSRTSSAENPLGAAAMRDAAREAVKMAGVAAHELLVRDEAGEAVGLYLADDDDAEAIGDPLANIAHRRGGLGVVANPDLADAIAALIGLALYAVKQVRRHKLAKRLRETSSAAAAEALSEVAEGDGPQVGPQAASVAGNG